MNADDKIQIQTTQNVTLLHEVASVGDRIFAYLTDFFIMIGLTLLLFFPYEKIIGFGNDTTLILGIIICLFPLCFYHLLLEVFNNGQSIGKKLLKIKVIRTDGTEPTLGNYVIRWITRIFEMNGIFGLSLIVMLINGKGQRLGDLAAGTTVAKIKKRISLEDTLIPFSAENYVPVYPQAENLSSKDIEIIKEALNYHARFGNHEIINACGIKVKRLFGIDPYKEFTPNETFLKTVVNDFGYYRSIDPLQTDNA
jgi:uncharacterized RDD family membrane protein YckC